MEIDVKKELLEINSTLNQAFGQINLLVLENPDFYIWPASPQKHHCFSGGLSLHSLEVVKFADDFCKKCPKLKRDILLTGAIWHDSGKLFEYFFNTKTNQWDYNLSFRKEIGHINHGYMEFNRAARHIFPNTIREHEILEVSHLILSHHRKAFGSNVDPETKEAWCLHLCDSLSAFVFGKP